MLLLLFPFKVCFRQSAFKKNFAKYIHRPVLDNPSFVGGDFGLLFGRSYAQSKLVNGRQSKGKSFTHK